MVCLSGPFRPTQRPCAPYQIQPCSTPQKSAPGTIHGDYFAACTAVNNSAVISVVIFGDHSAPPPAVHQPITLDRRIKAPGRPLQECAIDLLVAVVNRAQPNRCPKTSGRVIGRQQLPQRLLGIPQAAPNDTRSASSTDALGRASK